MDHASFISTQKNSIISTAFSIVNYDIDLIEGVRMICSFARNLDKDCQDLFIPLFGIDSDTDDLPIGENRIQYSKKYLQKKDEEMREYIPKIKETVFECCREIIDKFS